MSEEFRFMSELFRIVNGALRLDIDKVRNYTAFLAEKLEKAGDDAFRFPRLRHPRLVIGFQCGAEFFDRASLIDGASLDVDSPPADDVAFHGVSRLGYWPAPIPLPQERKERGSVNIYLLRRDPRRLSSSVALSHDHLVGSGDNRALLAPNPRLVSRIVCGAIKVHIVFGSLFLPT